MTELATQDMIEAEEGVRPSTTAVLAPSEQGQPEGAHPHLRWLAPVGLITSAVILLGCVSVLFATRQSTDRQGVLPGQSVIDAALVGPDGLPSNLSDMRGNVVLMVFNGSANSAVADEDAFVAAFKGRRDVKVVSVGSKSMADMVSQMPITLGDASLTNNFAVDAAKPTYFVIDQTGMVRLRSDGTRAEQSQDRRRAIDLVERLLVDSDRMSPSPEAEPAEADAAE